MSAFFGPGAAAEGYGPVPDADALAMYLMRVAHVGALTARFDRGLTAL
jgi:aspartate/glutamate/aspartate-prephenate aminotransferase